MKLTTLLLITAIMQVSASSFAQKISLSEKSASLNTVFEKIRLQSGYDFFFTSTILKDAKPVTIDVKNEELEMVLKKIFDKQPFEYTIEKKSVVVSKKEPSFLDKVVDAFQAIDVHGKVVDESGQPLIGATVTVKGTAQATTTDNIGIFALSNVPNDAILVVTFIGYETQELKAKIITAESTIVLKATQTNLKEVVVSKGYYNTTQELNTGNVVVVGAKDLAKNPVGDPIVALEGRVTGLYIAQSAAGGVPGSQLTIKLRGQNSLRDDANNPLFIVDGIPFTSALQGGNLTGAAGGLSPFSTIALNDIEDIQVLKDADATAIYGSRGANGVILIATKKGTSGKSKVDVNFYQGIGKVASKLDLMNTQQYLSMRNKALVNDGKSTPTATDYDLNGKWGDVNQYTDWQKVLIGGTSHITNADANISGGTAQTQFLFGGAYRSEGTVFPGDYRDVKASGHVNINHASENNRFKVNLSVNYLNDNNRLPLSDFTSRILLPPNSPVLYNSDGSLNWQNSTWTNPLRPIYQHTTNVTNNLNTALNLSYEVIKDLSVGLRAGYNTIDVNGDYVTPTAGANPNNPFVLTPASRQHKFSSNKITTLILEPTLNYNKTLGKGRLETLIGATFQQNSEKGIAQTASGFTSDVLLDNISAAQTVSVNSVVNSQYKYSAIYARIGYNYQDQYILNFTGRRDASSRFGPGKQFANFGAIGGAWIFSKQQVFDKYVPFISFGKLRVSYGITGNDQIPDYGFQSTYGSNGLAYQGANVLNPTQLTNPDFRWETVRKLEAAIDLGLFKDRVLLNISWYRNRTGNQLVGYPLPAITGFQTVQANLPANIQNQGTEFQLTTINIKSKSFQWTTSGNLSIPRSKLVDFPNLANSGYASRYQVGQPLNIAFLYHYTGIDANTGLYTFQDINRDGQINSIKDYVPIFVGQKFFGGLNNSFTYKTFHLDVFFQFVKQNGYKLLTPLSPGFIFSDGNNQPNYISAAGDPNSGLQKFTQSFSSPILRAYALYTGSDGALGDASFIRLKNVSLSWTFPEHYIKALKLQNARIYLQGQNLLTITGYKGLDPETASGLFKGTTSLRLPPLRMVTIGIQASL